MLSDHDQRYKNMQISDEEIRKPGKNESRKREVLFVGQEVNSGCRHDVLHHLPLSPL